MTKNNTAKLDFEAIRARLGDARGPAYWRSLEELAQTETFAEYIYNEFPSQAAAPLDSVTRRNFLKVMGASLALAGVTSGCARQPSESIFPYVQPPEEVVPGVPLNFATAFVMGGFATGVLVESHMGRPTKIEGHPKHPSSLGATDAFAQASILGLYDPDRSQAILNYGSPSATWTRFVAETRGILESTDGAGTRILTETITSPTLTSQLEAFLERYPGAKWSQYEPVGRDSAHRGAHLAFGEGNGVDSVYDFEKADRIVAFDSDFLLNGPGHVRYAKDFAARRDVPEHEPGDTGPVEDTHDSPGMNRLYVFESSPTNTGTCADHRFRVRASRIEACLRSLAVKLGVAGVSGGDTDLAADIEAALDVVAEDLKEHKGRSLVVVGDHQTASAHALAHHINDTLGAVGSTVTYIEPVGAAPPSDRQVSFAALVEEMKAGDVALLFILGGNPLYSAPVDMDFKAALESVETRVHLSLYEDETSVFCQWHVPETHYLEMWSDARAHDGTTSLIQPLIAPLYGGKSVHEFLSALTDEAERNPYDIVRGYWQSQRAGANFERFWAKSLSDGMIDGTQSQPKNVSLRRAADLAATTPSDTDSDFDIVFLPDPTVWDGTFSNNAWLQELPKPMTKLTWDNAVTVGVLTADKMGLQNEDVVEVSYGGRTIEGPIWIQPGHQDDTITLHLGYGREHAGNVGDGAGFNAYALRTSDAPGFGTGATLRKTGETYRLARTEEHYNIVTANAPIDSMTAAADRAMVIEVPVEEYKNDPEVVHHLALHSPDIDDTLYHPEEKAWDQNAWAMTIDLNKCTGCSSCVTACQAENNIPVVGKTEVGIGREMHWIRVDRYYKGDIENPKTQHQPLPCMQCENAPCEVVCPVGATQHSREGLNEMIYNRCIGTRYCSNNCPYKVRRFNFYNYSRQPTGRDNGPVYPEAIKLMYNPDVTIRSRGVMEKCTYCVQRINLARIDSKKSGKPIQDSDLQTACQQACPSSAITFGNKNNKESKVAKLRGSHRNYSILSDLNTRPRTTYLARLTNPNPRIAGEAAVETGAEV